MSNYHVRKTKNERKVGYVFQNLQKGQVDYRNIQAQMITKITNLQEIGRVETTVVYRNRIIKDLEKIESKQANTLIISYIHKNLIIDLC